MKDYFGYVGKKCVVTGAGSGMGEATAQMLVELGAEVYALDIKPVTVPGITQYIQVDLSEKDSIDHAFGQLPDKIDRYFGIAGLRGAMMPFMTVAKINLIANKYICEELLPEKMNEGGAIAIVSSATGVSWEKEGNKKYYLNVLNARGYEATVSAMEATGLTGVNGGFAYIYTKLAVNYLIAKQQGVYGPKGVRVNGLMPGDTATAFGSEDNNGAPTPQGETSFFAGYAHRMASAGEMAGPLVFLNSELASYISGALLPADFGTGIEIMAGLKTNPIGESMDSMFNGRH